MKKNLHVFFLFTLMAFFATVANARQVSLQTDQVTGSKYVIVPETDIDTLVVDGSTAFQVSNHTCDNDYCDNSDGSLVVMAPYGFKFHVSGSGTTEERKDCLEIFESLAKGDSVTLNESCSHDFEVDVSSAGNVIMFHFSSDLDVNAPGFVLTVQPSFESVSIPSDETDRSIEIPTGVSSFKIHVDEYESTRAAGSLELIAPEGFIIQINGLQPGEMEESLNIVEPRNMEGYTTEQYLWGGAAPTNGEMVRSSGRTLALQLNTYEEDFTLDLTATLLDITKKNDIFVFSVANGSVSSNPEKAAWNETVTLSITPEENYMLASMSVLDTNENVVSLPMGWFSGGSATFKMPLSPVGVTPVFTQKNYDNLSINMPESKMSEEAFIVATIPEGVSSFKVYDGGGENAEGTTGTAGGIILKVPLGNVLQVTGTVSSSSDVMATLTVLDGDTTGKKILSTRTPFRGGSEDVDVASSGNMLTLGFSTVPMMGEVVNAGNLELTVTVVPAAAHELAFGDYSHGIIASNTGTAYPGETITLITSADPGYILPGIEALDAHGNPVAVTGVEWRANNTATFVMPNDDVVVTPRFTNNMTAEGGLYRRMQPYSYGPSGMDMAEFTVPEGVKSFKLYASQDEYCNPNGIVLSSADGRTFLINGSISDDGRLYIGDGGIDDMDPNLQQASYDGFRSTIVGPYRSIENTVKFDYAGACADFDLTVELVKTTQYAAVTVEEVGTKTIATINGSYTDAGEVVIASDVAVDTVVFNRNFATGAYSTIVLPLSIKAGQVEGAEFYHLTGFEKVDGKWKTALISKVGDNDNLVANTPYLLEASETNLIFKPGGVPLTLNTTEKHPYTFASEDGSGYWEFRGTYEYIDYANDLPELLGRAYGFAAKEKNNYKVGDFARLKAGANTPAMRAYLVYNDGPMPQGGESMPKSALGSGIPSDLPETLEVVIVNDEGKSIGGGTINTVTGQIRMNHWYDLQGRKLNSKPTTKGTYYHKGKLVIIK